VQHDSTEILRPGGFSALIAERDNSYNKSNENIENKFIERKNKNKNRNM